MSNVTKRNGAIALSAAALLGGLGGCPTPTNPGGDGSLAFLDVDGNFSFDVATSLPISSGQTLRFRGRIDGDSDIDVFQIGNLAAGDRLVVDIQATSGDLDAVLAIFDNREYMHAFNDDRESDTFTLDPRIDMIVRGGQGPFYFGVGSLQGTNSSGNYTATVEIEPAVGLPILDPTIVYLDYRGGSGIVIDTVGTYNLPPFDANDVGFPGQTPQLKQRIEQIVADRFAGFNLVLRNSDVDTTPTSAHSTVYFGGRSPTAFAISEKIDTYNADRSDNTIIYTSSFEEAFGGLVTFEQMAMAMGNTVAHEIGHLLGLVHTADCEDLMDTRCGNASLLVPQRFKVGVLDATVFPIGFQNSEELLAWTIGLLGT